MDFLGREVFPTETVSVEFMVTRPTTHPSPTTKPLIKPGKITEQPILPSSSRTDSSMLPSNSDASSPTLWTEPPIIILEEVETKPTVDPTALVVVREPIPTVNVSKIIPTVSTEDERVDLANYTVSDPTNETIPTIHVINETISVISVISETKLSEDPIVPTEHVNPDVNVMNRTSTPSISTASSTSSPTIPRHSPRSSLPTKSSIAKEELHERDRSQASDTTVSSLGFDYRSYYRRDSFVPINISRPNTKWISGSSQFVDYMNTVFIPEQEQNVKNRKNVIVYMKRGTTGIAGQMSGMCDVLLLAILNRRAFQC